MGAVALRPLQVALGERSRRNIALAAGLSIAAHLLILAMPAKAPPEGPPPATATVRGPFTAQLRSPEPPPTATEVPRRARPESTAAPRSAPRPVPQERTVPQSDRAVAPLPPAPEPDAAPSPRPPPSFDMAALIQANRERRRAAEVAALRGTPPGREATGDEAARANLQRNLQTLAQGDGTGGVFEILRMGARTGEFAFNGWRPQRGRRWREIIEVDAGDNGDLERAIVRRMIALIREHYTGDFNWQSHRLGRVVVLSASPENNDALEEYLMREFFGVPVARRGF